MAAIRKKNNNNGNRQKYASQQSLDSYIYSICDIIRRSNCAGALQYIPELTWILFLRILDEQEQKEAETAEALDINFTQSLESPYRWCDWAAPYNNSLFTLDSEQRPQGWKRNQITDNSQEVEELNKLRESGITISEPFKIWVDLVLIPHLKQLKDYENATPRQKIISQVMSGVERVRIDTQKNLLDVLDKVHEISHTTVNINFIFPLSQVFEGLLLRMGEKGNDGGQFFTPRPIIQVMVKVIDPKIGETVYDPGLGTGGFLAQSYEHMRGKDNCKITKPEDLGILKRHTFYGREKDNQIYPIAIANLVLHGIDEPHVWHGNTLTEGETYGGLFTNAPDLYDVILMNPPFGGKEGKEAQIGFDYQTSATQALFLQHALKSLKPNGRCGIVLDEGILFRTNEAAFVATKRNLLENCNVWCIISLPAGTFVAAGGGVKANILFFTKGEPTEKIWYYDLSDIKVGKRTPLTEAQFEEFFRLLPTKGDSERSWTVDISNRKRQADEKSAPLKQQAAALEAEAQELKDRLRALKKAKQKDSEEYKEIEQAAKELDKEARELKAQAQAIDDAVYDLKAVNPSVKNQEDNLTPKELLDFIEIKGCEIAKILKNLRAK
ncbi:N-6 DNA methylase [Nostoc sp. 2RC]|uniref:class I SAM-dependent DNA methyltransferase n=1 Tax=Nostoc sp. 2RC TaxID=2485484 RepID=UPI001624334E|nr:N-6 DNA methylase [Nostoc sp. 2RC]MBC1239999.1 N-6 DNA methylase [Nostoc sp. 2RC]